MSHRAHILKWMEELFASLGLESVWMIYPSRWPPSPTVFAVLKFEYDASGYRSDGRCLFRVMRILRVGCSLVDSYICGFIGDSVRRRILRGLHCFNLFIVLVCWCVGVFFNFSAVYGTWISIFVC